jgi:hypothetical protein
MNRMSQGISSLCRSNEEDNGSGGKGKGYTYDRAGGWTTPVSAGKEVYGFAFLCSKRWHSAQDNKPNIDRLTQNAWVSGPGIRLYTMM